MNATIIAEIGANHQGQFHTACKMIEAAAEAGADAVKFQHRVNDVLLHPSRGHAAYIGPHSFGETYLEHREKLELPIDDLKTLKDLAHSNQVLFGVSVWEEPGLVDAVEEIKPDFLKLPSAESTNFPFINKARNMFDGILIVSLGMCTWKDIQRVAAIADGAQDKTTVLMHCVSVYPLDGSMARIGTVSRLMGETNHEVGYSSHDRGISLPLAARVLGATWIEKHFTLDRAMRGTDHAASLEPEGLRRMIRDIREYELAAQARDYILNAEVAPAKKLQRYPVAKFDIDGGRVIPAESVRWMAVKSQYERIPPAAWEGRVTAMRRILTGAVIEPPDVVITDG